LPALWSCSASASIEQQIGGRNHKKHKTFVLFVFSLCAFCGSFPDLLGKATVGLTRPRGSVPQHEVHDFFICRCPAAIDPTGARRHPDARVLKCEFGKVENLPERKVWIRSENPRGLERPTEFGFANGYDNPLAQTDASG